MGYSLLTLLFNFFLIIGDIKKSYYKNNYATLILFIYLYYINNVFINYVIYNYFYSID